MTDKEAMALAREALLPYRRGNHVQGGSKEIAHAVADAILRAVAREESRPEKLAIPSAENDEEAKAAGIEPGQLYRTGKVLMVRRYPGERDYVDDGSEPSYEGDGWDD